MFRLTVRFDVVEAKGWDRISFKRMFIRLRVGNPQRLKQHMGQLGGNGTSQTQFRTMVWKRTGTQSPSIWMGRGHTVTYDQVKGITLLSTVNGMVLRLQPHGWRFFPSL